MGREMETCNRRVPTSWTWGQWHWVSWAQFSPLGLEPCHHPSPVPPRGSEPLGVGRGAVPQHPPAISSLYQSVHYVMVCYLQAISQPHIKDTILMQLGRQQDAVLSGIRVLHTAKILEKCYFGVCSSVQGLCAPLIINISTQDPPGFLLPSPGVRIYSWSMPG